VRTTKPGTTFIHPGTNLADILCVQGKRVVAKSHTINDHRQGFQIPQSPH
jgi:hypothetical protein